jgi:hypothetical protein
VGGLDDRKAVIFLSIQNFKGMAKQTKSTKDLTAKEISQLLEIFETRFKKHLHRHKDISWEDVAAKLRSTPTAMKSLSAMESTGGEPDVVGQEKGQFLFMDCSPESPTGRRSLCYDKAALDARKEAKPTGSAMQMAESMGISLLSEAEYRHLQSFGPVDQKTSSWLLTPEPIRKLGGAIFGDYRYGQIFIYHNGVQSYYAGRAFRGLLRI